MKPIIKLPKHLLYDILNIYEFGTPEQVKKVEKLFKEQRPKGFPAKKHANLIYCETDEAIIESHWSDIFDIREQIKTLKNSKTNESKN